MINIREFSALIDRCSTIEECKIILHTILNDYVELEKEYEILEHQKIEVLMSSIDVIIGIKSNTEDIEYLKGVISSLKGKLSSHLLEQNAKVQDKDQS